MTPMMIAALAGIAGLVVGSIITAWIVKRPGNPTSPAAMKAELDGYQEEVAEHFAETAALVNKMTDSYKDVFDHLQGGASKLIGEEKLRAKLADQSEEVITLNRLGYTAAGATAGAATTKPTVNETAEQPAATGAESDPDTNEADPQVADQPDVAAQVAGQATDTASNNEPNDSTDGDNEPVQPPAAHS